MKQWGRRWNIFYTQDGDYVRYASQTNCKFPNENKLGLKRFVLEGHDKLIIFHPTALLWQGDGWIEGEKKIWKSFSSARLLDYLIALSPYYGPQLKNILRQLRWHLSHSYLKGSTWVTVLKHGFNKVCDITFLSSQVVYLICCAYSVFFSYLSLSQKVMTSLLST